MGEKILITILGNDIHPRFDMASEVLIANVDTQTDQNEEKVVVLPQSSSENLCNLIVKEGMQTVICGGIEDEYYQYLKWKKINVIDSVIGPYKDVMKKYIQGFLHSGEIVR